MQTATDQRQAFSDLASLSSAELQALLAEKDRLIAERDDVIADSQRRLKEKDRHLKEKDKLVKLLEEELRLAKQRRFGSSSEKLPFQGDFFDEAELEQALSDVEQQLTDAGDFSWAQRAGGVDRADVGLPRRGLLEAAGGRIALAVVVGAAPSPRDD